MNRVNQFNFIDKVCPQVIKEINKFRKNISNVPLFINGREIYDKQAYIREEQLCPYDHKTTVSTYTSASASHIKDAITGYQKGRDILNKMSSNQLYTIFDKMADLVEGKYKNQLLAATMLGQGKNIYQAEIDAISELVDFLRFNINYKMKLNSHKLIQTIHETNKQSWIPLKGFVAAISPFNFTAIGGNLASAPILMGNPVIWKPSDNAILSNYVFLQIMLEANLPPEVINFVPSNPNLFMNHIRESPDLGGLVFTGHSDTFDQVLKSVYSNVDIYKTYPRIVGETGGNNFHFVFPDYSNMSWLVDCCIRGSFEYSGQKCSATNRIYVPESLYPDFIRLMTQQLDELKVGSPEQDDIFTSAVIHQKSFNNLTDVIENNKEKVIYGGTYDDSVGYFINPTIFKVDDLTDTFLHNENFGPLVSVCVYPDFKVEDALQACATTGPYHLTGSVFSNQIEQMKLAEKHLFNNVGNLYLNDKSTGSVVGQQPFGGFGKSGTNDKAGSQYFLTRLANNRVVKMNNANSNVIANHIVV